MQWEQLTALALFAFVSTFTPGPNNLMLMTSGANVGFIKTIPHMLGITLGFPLMVLLVGFGLVGVFDTFPIIHQVLKFASLAYLFWLAYRIATSKSPDTRSEQYQPMSFIGAAAFQWINPKGWSMALTAVSVYNPSNSLMGLAAIAVIYALSNVPSASFWTVAGQQLQRFLTNPKRVSLFNWSMAILLIGSTIPMI
ncbi:LysE family translocator [Vibrio sp. LaRot3]|uniref:LysE family translocator n=1 Tax=Vibrio sp. LaRot3 TaxID=2998829 RepID=UPI0022CDF491|nr:LysE family translocator [Vibrio sp. LaRot3]MDA0148892.1 LysE family translocator [Vibrio sp. LaRot3]